MSACAAVKIGPPCSAGACEQTKTSYYSRIASAVFGALALAAGLLVFLNVPGISALGVVGGSILTAVGSIALIAAACVRCVAQRASRSETPPPFTVAHPDYRVDGNYSDRNATNLKEFLSDTNVRPILQKLQEEFKIGDVETCLMQNYGRVDVPIFLEFDLDSIEENKNEIENALWIVLASHKQLLESELSLETIGTLQDSQFDLLCMRLLGLPDSIDLNSFEEGSFGWGLAGRLENFEDNWKEASESEERFFSLSLQNIRKLIALAEDKNSSVRMSDLVKVFPAKEGQYFTNLLVKRHLSQLTSEEFKALLPHLDSEALPLAIQANPTEFDWNLITSLQLTYWFPSQNEPKCREHLIALSTAQIDQLERRVEGLEEEKGQQKAFLLKLIEEERGLTE